MEAALDEFAARGYAGARVADIAERAGVNKQLISYHFGGKAGLYQALCAQWQERKTELTPEDVPLADLAAGFLREYLADPRGLRLQMWRALADDAQQPPETEPEDKNAWRRHQTDGELAADLDQGAIQLLLTAAVAFPVIMPAEVRRVTGMDPRSEEFEQYYTEQLRRVIRRLGG